ncbi:hypothetical protein Gogos_001325, partial [Gossypium gossypioides]|nr:hypothetical protein [Gossypium gossypioides]
DANSGINFAFRQVEDEQLRCFHESFELLEFISEISFSFHDSKEHNIMITSFKTAMQKGKSTAIGVTPLHTAIFSSSGFGRRQYGYIAAAIPLPYRYLHPWFFEKEEEEEEDNDEEEGNSRQKRSKQPRIK